MKIILETERLLVREFNVEDAHLLYDLNSNPEVVKFFPTELSTTIEAAEKVLEEIILPQYQLYNHGRWALHLKETNTFIGWCGLKYLKESDEIDLGYRLKQEFWGNGYATESAKASIEYGFNGLKMKQMFARAHIHNDASQNVIVKCGFKYIKEEIHAEQPTKVYLLNI